MIHDEDYYYYNSDEREKRRQQQLSERFQEHFNEYMGIYLHARVFLPNELANDFVDFVYTKHGDFNQDLLMDELRKAMRIHMHLNNPRNDKQTRKLV